MRTTNAEIYNEFQKGLESIIDRISDLQVEFCDVYLVDIHNLNQTLHIQLLDPGALRIVLDELSRSKYGTQSSVSAATIFGDKFPEFYSRIYKAYKENPLVLSIEFPLNTKSKYQILANIGPDGLKNASVSENAKREAYKTLDLLYGNFFVGEDHAA